MTTTTEMPESAVRPEAAVGLPPSSPVELPVGESTPEAGEKNLENVLCEITELAKKVGGFKKLAEIANTLDMGK
jgi:hypothetical protein